MKIHYLIAASVITLLSLSSARADTDKQFDHAVGAFKSGNYGSAELLFKKVIDAGDDDYLDRAWYYYARSIYHQKKYKSAIFEFNNFVNKSRTMSLSTESRFWMGECYYRMKEPVKAIEEYNRFITIGAGNKLVPAAHDRIAAIYYAQRRFDEAIIEWSASIAKSKNKSANAHRVYRIGDALFRDKKYEESLQRLYPLITARVDQKNTARAQILVGRIHQKTGNHQKALSMFQSIPVSLLKDRYISAAYYFQALSYIKLKEQRKAASLLDIYLLIGKDTPWYYNAKYELGRLLLKLDEGPKAIDLLEDVRAMSKNEKLKIDSAKLLSDVYIKKNPSKAIPYLQQSLVTDNQERKQEVVLLLAKAYLKIRDFDNCDKMLSLYSEKYPFDPRTDEVMFLSARVYLEKGDMGKALQNLEKIEKEYPFSKYLVESKYYIAYAKNKHGKAKEVVALLNEYLSNQNIKNHYRANLLLLDSYLALNDAKNADAAMNKIITKYIDHPGVEKSIYSYAQAIDDRGVNPWKYYNIIIARFPKTASAMAMYLRIGNGFYKEKKYKEAIIFYDKYLSGDVKTDTGTAYFNKLMSLYNLKQYPEVIAAIEKGNMPMMDETQWEQIPLLVSRSHFFLGHYDQAHNNFYLESLPKYKNGDLFMFGKSAVMVGDIATANEIVKFIKADTDQFREVVFGIAERYKANNDIPAAKQQFARIISDQAQGEWADRARLQLADLFIKDGEFGKAQDLLAKITTSSLEDDKHALTALSLFGKKDAAKALSYTQAKIASILGSEYGEEVVKRNVEHFFAERNTLKFNQYMDYMKRFKGKSEYIYYTMGKFNYYNKQFPGAFASFNRLSGINSKYKDEVNYYLGTIALHQYKNINLALNYFQKAAESTADESIFKWKSKINIAIIHYENNDRDKAEIELMDIVESLGSGCTPSQAFNLKEHFEKNNEQ